MSRSGNTLCALLGLALLPASAPAFAATAVQREVTFTVHEGQLNTDYYIQIPEGATHLKLKLTTPRRKEEDVDLFLRYGEPFPAGQNPYPQSLYWSAGNTGLEHLYLSYASKPPVSPGRWFLAVYNPNDPGGRLTAKVTLRVEIRSEAEPSLKPLDIKISYTDPPGFGFNNNYPFPGEGDNHATTLGEARRIAFEKAVSIIEQTYTSPIPIVVEAQFVENRQDIPPFAFAPPTEVAYDFPGAPVAGTWYAAGVIPRLAGTDYCRVYKEIQHPGASKLHTCTRKPIPSVAVSFSTKINHDQWWYGLNEPQPGINGVDFIRVALHELIHGLGFIDLVDVKTGEKRGGRDDIYSDQLVYRNNDKDRPFNGVTNKRRRQAMTSEDQLFWDGAFAKTWENPPTGNGRLVLYAPAEPTGNAAGHVNFPDIMYPGPFAAGEHVETRSPGAALGAAWYFLHDTGWSPEPKPKLEPGGPRIERGLYFDPRRNGHGFDLQRSGENWFLLVYTYDKTGAPDWYMALLNETSPWVFSGDLFHFTYEPNDPDGDGNPQQGVVVGSVIVDFTTTLSDPACDDGFDRPAGVEWARFAWSIGGQSGDWCVRPLPVGTELDPDFTGAWYAGQGDNGWGMSITYAKGQGDNVTVVDTLYYYDAEGNPRWAQGVIHGFANGQPIQMLEFDGYPRTAFCNDGCSVQGDDHPAGTLSLTLKMPSYSLNTGNRVSVDVTYQGGKGGGWMRDDVPIALLSDPAS